MAKTVVHTSIKSKVAGALAAAVAIAGSTIGTASGQANGIGPDKDGDTNPATDAFGFYQQDSQTGTRLDSPFQVVNFEPPPGSHGDVLRTQYKDGFGVTFSRGLKLQRCAPQHYFRYETQCTYEAPASGKFAAVYRDDYRRPLRIRFDEPVCATALSIYPTGGAEGERFRVKLDLYEASKDGNAAQDKKVASTHVDFSWTENTFRWRSKVIAFLENQGADRVDVSMRSLGGATPFSAAENNGQNPLEALGPAVPYANTTDNPWGNNPKNIIFLIDDVAFVSAGDRACKTALDSLRASTD